MLSLLTFYGKKNIGSLEKGGVGALELVAMDMKARLAFFFQDL